MLNGRWLKQINLRVRGSRIKQVLKCIISSFAYGQHSPSESPQMELPIKRSDLGLIEEYRDYILHKSVLVEYTERSSMRQPRDSLGEFRNTVGELEHCVELCRESSLRARDF